MHFKIKCRVMSYDIIDDLFPFKPECDLFYPLQLLSFCWQYYKAFFVAFWPAPSEFSDTVSSFF